MKIIKISLFLFLSLFFFSCDNDDDTTNNVCENNYLTEAIITAFATTNGYTVLPEFMDLETHEFIIQINASGEICTIGYQNPSTYTGTYTMEVRNHNNPTVNYLGVHSFSQTGMDYQNITPVAVSSGDFIMVRRTITAGYTNLNETIGRTIRKTGGGDIPYPITQGNVTFISSNFYDGAGPGSLDDFLQPVIGLGFKVY